MFLANIHSFIIKVSQAPSVSEGLKVIFTFACDVPESVCLSVHVCLCVLCDCIVCVSGYFVCVCVFRVCCVC